MPHPYSFNQVQIIGDCYNQADIWTTGFSLGSTTQGAPDPTQLGIEKVAELWETFFKTPGIGFGSVYRTTAVKLNKMGTDGRQVTDPTLEYVYPAPITPPAAQTSGAPQLTMALSLRATQNRGLATKGRMYLPVNGLTIGGTGRIQPTQQTNLLNAAVLFFQGLMASIDVPGGPVLTSGAGLLGATNHVTHLALGDVMDTQRRRRNAIAEEYQEQSLNP